MAKVMLDTGAIGPTGVQEKDSNLRIAGKVAQYLRPISEVLLTREDDSALGSNGRPAVSGLSS